MSPRPPESTRPSPLFPYPSRCRSGAAIAAEAISAGQRAKVAEGVAHDHRVPIFTKQDHLAVAILLHRNISLVVDGAAWLAIAGIFGDETVRIGHRADADIGKLPLDCIADGLENSGAGRPALDPRRHADQPTDRTPQYAVVMENGVPSFNTLGKRTVTENV